VVGVLNVTERQGTRPFTALELEYANLISKIAASAIEDILSRKVQPRVMSGLPTLRKLRSSVKA